MGNSIRLSRKHGVNPSLMTCPLCGKDTGVALFGRLANDAEAPRRVADESPCDECKERMKSGIVLVSARCADGITKFTGLYVVIREDSSIFDVLEPAMRQEILARRYALMEDEFAQVLGIGDAAGFRFEGGKWIKNGG